MGASIDGFSYEEMESIWLDFDKYISDMYNLSDIECDIELDIMT